MNGDINFTYVKTTAKTMLERVGMLDALEVTDADRNTLGQIAAMNVCEMTPNNAMALRTIKERYSWDEKVATNASYFHTIGCFGDNYITTRSLNAADTERMWQIANTYNNATRQCVSQEDRDFIDRVRKIHPKKKRAIKNVAPAQIQTPPQPLGLQQNASINVVPAQIQTPPRPLGQQQNAVINVAQQVSPTKRLKVPQTVVTSIVKQGLVFMANSLLGNNKQPQTAHNNNLTDEQQPRKKEKRKVMKFRSLGNNKQPQTAHNNNLIDEQQLPKKEKRKVVLELVKKEDEVRVNKKGKTRINDCGYLVERIEKQWQIEGKKRVNNEGFFDKKLLNKKREKGPNF